LKFPDEKYIYPRGAKFDNMIYQCISKFMTLLGALPLSLGRIMGRTLGSLWYAADKKHRTLCLDNLQKSFKGKKSRKEISHLAKQVFQNTASMLFEHAWFHGMGAERFLNHVTINGLDNLIQAHENGKGVICISGHLSNWELASCLPAATGIPLSAVYKTIKYPPLDRYVKGKRNATGCVMLPLHNALDGIKESLARGEHTGLFIDQNSKKRTQSVFIDFMGRTASAYTGPARLALSTRAPVIPVFIYKKRDRFFIDILSEVPIVETGDKKRDVTENTETFHRIVENYVKKYPEQWFWIHNRWRTQPKRL
jgi:KDO2-lipid IV(A) lauroyltransferase